MGAEGIVCLSHARWVWREGARKLHAYSAAPPVRAPPTGSQVGAYGHPPRGASPGLSGGRSVFDACSEAAIGEVLLHPHVRPRGVPEGSVAHHVGVVFLWRRPRLMRAAPTRGAALSCPRSVGRAPIVRTEIARALFVRSPR